MATLLLSAAGAAIGSGLGGTVLGLSGAVVGRAVGATVGRSIDQRILGSGSDVVESGRIDRFHLNGVGYGTPIKEVWGRTRISGEIIWASRFQENRRISGGSKGNPGPASESFSYTVSIAIALCIGEARRVGRVWADGIEIALNSLNLRFYPGSEDQLPDPKIEVVEGVGNAPSYRGISYVVIEDLVLAQFGNRVPQFSFEVVRSAQPANGRPAADLAKTITAVTLIPGSGEYALATTPVRFDYGLGRSKSANVHSIQGITDFSVSLNQLTEELPNCAAVSLVVSWFGSDLRCESCLLQPKVEQREFNGVEMPWNVSGIERNEAQLVPLKDGRPIYGGTPADASVIEAIKALRNSGKEVMFYPFILMDQEESNTLPNPWNPLEFQPALPWRGRISLNIAPGLPGSTDQSTLAGDELTKFLGEAQRGDFSPIANNLVYTGPQEWSFRRFILHYAHLCAVAGGVDSFCIGSELRGLTQIRSSQEHFPMVEALRILAAEVKLILGNETKVSYAADWTEYFGYHIDDHVFFHLDSLWADSNIDFVGIDNYMPISDWREGTDHLDSGWGSIYNIQYLINNIGGGQGFDWYYDSSEGEVEQRRVVIEDREYGEEWVFRYKDIGGWWSHSHHNRLNGIRSESATNWIAGMKPIVFTEYGCAALDKSTNQPNLFLDSKSSESALPRSSTGGRDDFIQMQYFLAMSEHWSNENNNPRSELYDGYMVDFFHSYAWAWDARPFPEFPGNVTEWSDNESYQRGHWLNGRSSSQSLSDVISEFCRIGNESNYVNADDIFGSVRGFSADGAEQARGKLQSLMMAYNFEAHESEGFLVFRNLFERGQVLLFPEGLVLTSDLIDSMEIHRSSFNEEIGKVVATYIVAESDFEIGSVESYLGLAATNSSQSELRLVLTDSEARGMVEKWAIQAQTSRESVALAVPMSFLDNSIGDSLVLSDSFYRIDRFEESAYLRVFASKIDPRHSRAAVLRGSSPSRLSPLVATPVFAAFMDLPLLNGSEVPHAPHIAVSRSPWSGTVAVWSSSSDSNYVLNSQVASSAVVGTTLDSLSAGQVALWDHGSVVRIQVAAGTLSSASMLDVLNGANIAALGDGGSENWEVFQFAEAKIIDQDIYELSVILRGLAGTDAIMPAIWPVGSLFVLIDASLPQIALPEYSRGLLKNYRVGSLDQGVLDQNVVSFSLAFSGVGLRPYSVVHLSYKGDLNSGVDLFWVRRTRVNGDSWQNNEVPLGEDSLSFSVRVFHDSVLLRDVTVTESYWRYSSEMHLVDGLVSPVRFTVAQNSIVFGPGPERSLVLI